jgi:hypothetical protein
MYLRYYFEGNKLEKKKKQGKHWKEPGRSLHFYSMITACQCISDPIEIVSISYQCINASSTPPLSMQCNDNLCTVLDKFEHNKPNLTTHPLLYLDCKKQMIGLPVAWAGLCVDDLAGTPGPPGPPLATS